LTGGLGDDTFTGGAGMDRLVEMGDVNFTLTNTSLTGLGADSLAAIERVSLTGGRGPNSISAIDWGDGIAMPTGVTIDGGPGDDGEHARPVGDLEVDVERRDDVAVAEPLELAPAGVVLQEAGAARADHADHVGDDRRGRLEPAGARPLERDLADRVALQHDRV